MDVHQMFLKLVWFGEVFTAAAAPVLSADRQVVERRVRLQLLVCAGKQKLIVRMTYFYTFWFLCQITEINKLNVLQC